MKSSSIQICHTVGLGLAVFFSGLTVSAQTVSETSPDGKAVSAATGSQPVSPVFQIQRYELIGNTVLADELVREIVQEATGATISLPQIRRVLVKLQEVYRGQGYTKASVTLPKQSLTDGVVRVHVIEGPNASKTEALADSETGTRTIPAYELRHFEVRGNTALSAEEIDAILGPIAGAAVSLEVIQKALGQLQAAYRERGYTRAQVSLPQQVLTDGVVAIEINEGRSLEAERAILATRDNPVPIQPPPPPRTFEVRRYEVSGNTLLRPEVIDQILTNATGSSVTLPQIQKALGELQLAYRERGYATVGVGLPQQQLADAVVKVQITEGLLTDINITGNRHFSSNNVMRALPSLHTNALLNSRIFQRELDIANQNRDRQIYPTIGPGPEPGTSALTLRVKDRFPLHGRIEVNNYATPGTPEWRVNASGQYNNLWQLEHQMGLSYGFTPEAFKSDGLVPDYFFNRPLVANYGAYYRLPFGTPESVQEQINSSAAFGYDEATRQFRLPPAGARPDLSVFASASSSDTGVQYGSAAVVSETPLLKIVSQDSGQNLSINENVGARLSIPQTLSDAKRFSYSFGPDWKRYYLESFNTNNFVITTVVTNAQGSQTIESRVSSAQPVRRNEVGYLPLSFGVDYFGSDPRGTFSASLGLSGNFVGNSDDFAAASYSPKAEATYGRLSLALTREQQIFREWKLFLRASGQAATGPLISNEQFALGGINSVRGYFEGDQYGDAGWFGSVELRTPFLATKVPIWSDSVPVWLRGSIFLDGGQRFLMDSVAGSHSGEVLLGVGFGVSANINNYFDLRLTVGWPLRDSVNTSANDPRAYLSLGGQF